MTPQQEKLREAEQNTQAAGSNEFQIGDAHIKPSLNRIEIDDTDHQLEPKVMQVLLLLSARPGHVIQREALLHQVWGRIEDDYLLNRAISELRKIFSDSASKPTYIETIRKTGYRLLAPIKPVASAALVYPSTSKAPAASTRAIEASLDPSTAPSASKVNIPANAPTQTFRPPHNLAMWLAAFLLIALLSVLGLLQLYSVPDAPSLASYQVYPLTSRIGREYDPALSPDGSRIVYVADRQEGGNAVFMKMLNGENALQLSQQHTYVRFPKWMPDGQSIIYAELTESGLRIIQVSPLGGARRVLFSDNATESLRGLAISPDGTRIAYSKRNAASTPMHIGVLSLPQGHNQKVTDPKQGSLGDIDPLFSPDGRSLIFVRSSDEVTKDIYSIELSTEKLKRLTFDNRKINGVTWSPDGNKLLFTSTRSGLYRLWWINSKGGEPQALSLGLETVQRPSTTLGIEALVFEDWKHRATLVSVNLATEPNEGLKPLLRSTRWDSSPAISPDGKRLLYASDRGGSYSLWLSELESEASHQWFNLSGAFIDNPAWSPDGRQVVFDASPDGHSQLYLMREGSAVPIIIAAASAKNRNPSWSKDGQWIYFESYRQSRWQLMAFNVDSKEVRKLDVTEGRNPQASADGQWILYTSNNGDGIWRCHREKCLLGKSAGSVTSKREQLIYDLDPKDATNWVAASEGIYFIRRQASAAPQLALHEYLTNSEKNITALPKGFNGWGMVISPDESQLIMTQHKPHDSDIRIARP
ncbi:Periplasmic component of the Tol biopolymer transport system [Alteromonadaceae bacterium Bs31]|nr:Periplasmic component of the Tol biopolymer transport system [Alteromonadaceae bacterium Bs31]